MKSAAPELIALLNDSTQFCMADLLTITLKNGTVLRYTSADISLAWGGNTFVPFLFQRSRTRLVVGVEVDSCDLTLMTNADLTLGGSPYPRFAQDGGFDGAAVRIDRAFLADWSQPIVGSLWMFSGKVSDVWPTRTQIRLAVKSDLEGLNVLLPRNLYQPKCMHSLYDTGCGVSKAAYKATGTAASGSTVSLVKCGLTQNAGWFDRGVVTFTSGAIAGLTRTIRSYTPGNIVLSLPLPYAPAVGDAFEAYPGCDRLQGTCEGKFNNKAKFKGFPYVPVPETVY